MASVVFRAAENGFLAEAAMPIRGYVRKSPSLLGRKFLWNDGSVVAFSPLSRLASESGEAQTD
jgi:hypothetical protein